MEKRRCAEPSSVCQGGGLLQHRLSIDEARRHLF